MANQEHLSVLKQGVQAWNAWRLKHPDIRPDLSHADLKEIDLSGAYFRNTYLFETNLTKASLVHADFSWADLTGVYLTGAILKKSRFLWANLNRASLQGSILREANLYQANLNMADLSQADLSEAKLDHVTFDRTTLWDANLCQAGLGKAIFNRTTFHQTDFSRARLGFTIFGDVDLSEVRGLETVMHLGPSSIGIDTIYHSKGNIPENFLRGAGLPDSFITYAHSLVHQPFDYYTCFISYSSKDEALARRLHADLQDHGVRCWFAPEDMKIGDKIRPRIDEAIHLQDKLLLILSTASVASDWVEHEVEMALVKERKEQRIMLFPIRVDQAILDQEDHGWTALVRHQRHIGDLTNWTDPQVYQSAFDRLLRDLKRS